MFRQISLWAKPFAKTDEQQYYQFAFETYVRIIFINTLLANSYTSTICLKLTETLLQEKVVQL